MDEPTARIFSLLSHLAEVLSSENESDWKSAVMSADSARGPYQYCINDNEEGDNEDNDLGVPAEKSEGGRV